MPGAAARAVRDEHDVDAARPRSRAASASAVGRASCPRRRHQLDAGDERAARQLARQPDFSRRRHRRLRVRLARDRRRATSACRRVRAARRPAPSLHGRADLADVLRRRAAAPADQPHARGDEAPRVRRHVLGRAQVDVAALDVARLAGVGLRRQRHVGDRAMRSTRLEHRRRADAAVDAHDVARRARRAPARTARAACRRGCCRRPRWSSARRSAGRTRARTAAMAAPISFRSRNVSSMNRSTPPSSERRAPARGTSRRLVDAGLAPRLDAHAERADGAGDVGRRSPRAPARARRAPGQVDRVHLVGEAEGAQLDAVGAEGVGLDDVGARRAGTPGGPRRPGRAASG